MFTGIIETTGQVKSISSHGTNKTFWIASSISAHCKVDQSLAHDGVCLTIEAIDADSHKVTAIAETLQKTSLESWKTGGIVNLERCMQLSARVDGHFVQGHTDTKGIVVEKKDLDGSWEFTIQYAETFAALLIEKGSIAVNGISLTAFNVGNNTFTVAIIPYTYQHTNLALVNKGHSVNLEFDMLGKYIVRHAETAGKNNLS